MFRNVFRSASSFATRVGHSDKVAETLWNGKRCDQLLWEKLKVKSWRSYTTALSAKQKGSSNLTWSRLYSYRKSANENSSTAIGLGTGLMAFSLFGKKDDEKEEEDVLITTIKWAKLHAHKGELEKSDKKYHDALNMVQSRGRSGEWDRSKVIQAQTYLFDSMANLALQAMQLQKAEQLFKETMVGLLEMGREKTDDAMVEISLKLAVIYGMMDKHMEAEAGYKFCIDSLQGRLAKDMKKGPDFVEENTLALLGMSLNSYARYMIVQKKYDSALQNLERSMEIAKNVLGADHHQVSVLYSDAATINSMKGDYQAAKEYIDKAVELGKKTDSPDLAMYVCNQGVVELNLGHGDVAKKLCSDAFRMAQKLDDKITMKEARVCLENVKKEEKK